MKYSGIGGQAVLEGVMMRNNDKYAVAVRKPDKEIEVQVKQFQSLSKKYKVLKLPLLRGIVSFVESLYIGMKALSFSASLFEEEEKAERKNEKKENLMTGLTVTVSILMAIGVFMALPYGLSLLFHRFFTSNAVLTALEGVIRLVILISYMVGISFLPDIRRVYMYHGAEHKAINCIESGIPLTVKNVRKMTRKHLRCGTSFIIDVIILSIILFMFIRVENAILRLVFRLLLVPVIAAIAYEFIRIAGNSENIVVKILSIPGLWFQGLTTKEPEDEMIEVAIQSVEAVFDWKSFLEEKPQKLGKLEKSEKITKKNQTVERETEKEKKEEIMKSSVQKEKLRNDKDVVKREASRSIENVVVNVREEEDDDILNAFDRFFSKQKEESNKKRQGK